MSKYKDAITAEMTEFGADTRFIGYNTAYGSRMYGTLSKIPECFCLETPICENLMVGLAMGMSLEGYRPVVCFERHDFLLIALDAIVNHLDKMFLYSGGQFDFPVIIRTIVGTKTPLNPGIQHTMDYTEALQKMLKRILVLTLNNPDQVHKAYHAARNTVSPMVLVEYKSLY